MLFCMDTETFTKLCQEKAEPEKKEDIERWIRRLNDETKKRYGKKRKKHYSRCLLKALGYDFKFFLAEFKSGWQSLLSADIPYIERGEKYATEGEEEYDFLYSLWRITASSEN